MAYSTIADLKNYVPESQIREATDDNNTGDIDIEKLNDAIRRADDHIDSYLRGRYELPLVTVPDMVHDLSTRLAAYYLYKRSLLVTLPEVLASDYKDCVDMLSKIQRGIVSPFPVQANPSWMVTNKRDAVTLTSKMNLDNAFPL